jgi:hypothetical protein
MTERWCCKSPFHLTLSASVATITLAAKSLSSVEYFYYSENLYVPLSFQCQERSPLSDVTRLDLHNISQKHPL